jgi:hypothetical protein
MWCFYGLNYVTVCACFYDMSMLASMLRSWATVRGISFLETSVLVNRKQPFIPINAPIPARLVGNWHPQADQLLFAAAEILPEESRMVLV